MNALRHRWLAISLVLLACLADLRVEAADDMRLWTSRSGQSLQAVLTADNGDSIQLHGADGKIRTISMSVLSDADVAYLEKLRNPSSAVTHEILILYNNDIHIAESIADLLNEHGFKAQLQSVGELTEWPLLGSISVMVLTHDTAEWCKTESAARLTRQLGRLKLPILAMGISGSQLFSLLELHLGKNPVVFTGDSLIVPPVTPAAYNEPQKIPATEGQPIQLYTKANSVYGTYFENEPSYIKRLGTVIDSRLNYLGLAIEDDRYGLWGFVGSPQIMSEEGLQLFVNMVHALAKSSPLPGGVRVLPANSPPLVQAAPTVPEQLSSPMVTQPVATLLSVAPVAPVPSPPPQVQVYPAGKEQVYSARELTRYQFVPSSKEDRAASLNYDFEVATRPVEQDPIVAKTGEVTYPSKSDSGNVRYNPVIKVFARNKEITENSRLVIEYYSRTIGRQNRDKAGVQHILLPKIARGSSITLEAPGVVLAKNTYKNGFSHRYTSGSELFGMVIGLYDAEQKLLIQHLTHQSLKEVASSTLPEPTL